MNHVMFEFGVTDLYDS